MQIINTDVTPYRLSKEADEILERRANAVSTTKERVLEAMILYFGKSSGEERIENIIRKKKARKDFLETVKYWSYDELPKIWNNGWANGWLHFQIRKKSNRDLFIKKIDETVR